MAERRSNGGGGKGNGMRPAGRGTVNPAATKEAGTIEKLLHSYGFICCTDRKGRLFFHYSHFDGQVDSLNIGDAVEFEVVKDRKSGKPIATNVVRFGPQQQQPGGVGGARPSNSGVVLGSMYETEWICGTLTSLPTYEQQGRVSYEHRGECFFLAYSACGCDEARYVTVGDPVRFVMVLADGSTDGASGVWEAAHVHAIPPANAAGTGDANTTTTNGTTIHNGNGNVATSCGAYQGVVCSLKESFGFVERSDIVKEIFFHESECAQWEDLALGDDVGFDIQMRNGKEVAVNVERLPPGTVVFEDISEQVCFGRVTALPQQQRNPNGPPPEPLSGRILPEDASAAADESSGEAAGVNEELPWGERDPSGEYTLREGDRVEFCVATDRRDHLRRATRIRLQVDETLPERHLGTIATLKDQFGFVVCEDDDENGGKEVYFRRCEVVDDEVQPPQVGQYVRFEMVPDTHSGAGNRMQAIRVVRVDAPPLLGSSPPRRSRQRGYVVALKESFGFIEDVAHKRDIFFHYSMYSGKSSELYLGLPVEFNIVHKQHKQSAEDVKPYWGSNNNNTPNGNNNENGAGNNKRRKQKAITNAETGLVDAWESNLVVDAEVLTGTVERTLRMFQTGQEEYTGRIAWRPTIIATVDPVDVSSPTGESGTAAAIVAPPVVADESETRYYDFCVMSLCDLSDCINTGDVVEFRVARDAQSGHVVRAVCVKPVREVKQAVVEAIKGQFGFLTYETAEGKRLFFHMSEVQGNIKLNVMDTVKFVLVKNHRTGKSSACHLERVAECTPSPRPQHLIARLRGVSSASGSAAGNGGVSAIRAPKGPEEGSNGFSQEHRDRMMALLMQVLQIPQQDSAIADAGNNNNNKDGGASAAGSNNSDAGINGGNAVANVMPNGDAQDLLAANSSFEENNRAVSVTA